ncbi:hypothetical protein J3F83DRAFT_756438 [Trichoderma novae-zelandiae]
MLEKQFIRIRYLSKVDQQPATSAYWTLCFINWIFARVPFYFCLYSFLSHAQVWCAACGFCVLLLLMVLLTGFAAIRHQSALLSCLSSCLVLSWDWA